MVDLVNDRDQYSTQVCAEALNRTLLFCVAT